GFASFFRAIVHHAFRLAIGPGDRIRIADLDPARDPDDRLDVVRQIPGRLCPGVLGTVARGAFDVNDHVVHPARTAQFDLEMRRETPAFQDLLLDLGRKDIDAAQDDHVVGPAGDLLDPAHRPGGAGQQPGQVAGAITHHRQALFGQRGEYEFAHLAVL